MRFKTSSNSASVPSSAKPLASAKARASSSLVAIMQQLRHGRLDGDEFTASNLSSFDKRALREVQTAWAGRSERIPTVGERSVETAAIEARKRRQIEIGTAESPNTPRPIQTTPVAVNPLPLQPPALTQPSAVQPPSVSPRTDLQYPAEAETQSAAASYTVEEPQIVHSKPRRTKGDRAALLRLPDNR